MMIKKIKFLVFIPVILLALGIIGSVWIMNRPHGTWVEVLQDQAVLYKMDLATAEDQVIEVEYNERIITIQIENHQIRVQAAECPDHICVSMGWLDSAIPIVCLPNRLVIQFIDSGDEMDVIVN